MGKLCTFILTGVATLWATAAFAACDLPKEVSVPNGSQASMDEMVAAQTAVKAYIAEMEDYLKCLDADLVSLGEEPTQEQADAHRTEYNAAVDTMNRVANSFNEEIRAYKALNN